MSGNFEGAIRPFQLPAFTPPQVAPDTQYIPNRNPIIAAGAQGSVKTLSGSYDLTITFYQIKKPKEETSSGGSGGGGG
jgi:hypothetical protein